MLRGGLDDEPTPESQSLSSTGRMLSPLGSPIRDARSAHPRFIYLRVHTTLIQENIGEKVRRKPQGIAGTSQTTGNVQRKKDLKMERRTDLVI